MNGERPAAGSITSGMHVKWRPPTAEIAASIALLEDHPGIVEAADERSVLVNWAGRPRTAEFLGSFDPSWLMVISDVEHAQLVMSIKDSDEK